MALAVEGVVDGGADAAALAGVAVARGDAVLAPDSAVTPLADAQEAVGASGLARAPDARRHLAPLHLGEQSESLFLLIFHFVCDVRPQQHNVLSRMMNRAGKW